MTVIVQDHGFYQTIRCKFTVDKLQPMLKALFASADSGSSALDRLSGIRKKLQLANDQPALRLFDSLLPKRLTESRANVILRWVVIGRLIEQIDVAPLEPYALAGKRQARRNAQIATNRTLTQAAKDERVQAVQRELVRQAKESGRVNRELAYRTVASQTGLSKDAIKKPYLSFQKRAK